MLLIVTSLYFRSSSSRDLLIWSPSAICIVENIYFLVYYNNEHIWNKLDELKHWQIASGQMCIHPLFQVKFKHSYTVPLLNILLPTFISWNILQPFFKVLGFWISRKSILALFVRITASLYWILISNIFEKEGWQTGSYYPGGQHQHSTHLELIIAH